METTKLQVFLCKLTPPVQWQAGFIGDTPFYFDCAGCGAKAPKIAGILATSPNPTYQDILIVHTGDKRYTWDLARAMYCAECLPKVEKHELELKCLT
jgi:hypothetical protein